MTESLGEALPREVSRVRDEVLPRYLEIGASGAIAAAMTRAELDRASRAMIEGDVVEMVAVYRSLKEWEV